jgi:FMN phosphatase YigB (HAD superfamily)
MADYRQIKALFIDIDDTLVRFKAASRHNGKSVQNTGSLLDCLRLHAEATTALSSEEIVRRIKRVQTEVNWWHWSDFIVELGLNAKLFWEFAYQREREYLEPSGPELVTALHRLHENGILLYITSNNPSSGILHKLRIAGVASVTGTTLFQQLLGATELHAMKWDEIYWKKALAHTGLDPEEVAVVGDDLRDDYEVPAQAGYAHSFIINRRENLAARNSDSVTFIQDFNQLTQILTPAGVPIAVAV